MSGFGFHVVDIGDYFTDDWRVTDYAEGVRDAREYVDRLERGEWLPSAYFGSGWATVRNPAAEDAADAAFDAAQKRNRMPLRTTPRPKWITAPPIPFHERPLEWRAAHSRYRCATNPVFTWEEIENMRLDPNDKTKHPIKVELDMASLRIRCATCKRNAQIDVDTFKLKHQTPADKHRVPPWKKAA